MSLYPEENRARSRGSAEALHGRSSWFSTEDGKKGALAPGQLADLAVLSADYFSIPEEEIKHLESVLTIVGGKIVYATAEFSKLAPPALPVSPDWSPVKEYGGYAKRSARRSLGASHSVFAVRIVRPPQLAKQSSHLPVLGDLGLWELGLRLLRVLDSSAIGGRIEMKMLFVSFVVGLGVGVFYGLIRVKSPAPPS